MKISRLPNSVLGVVGLLVSPSGVIPQPRWARELGRGAWGGLYAGVGGAEALRRPRGRDY